MSLKPCPCGQTPNRVLIQAEHARPKFAYCGGDCCEDWRIEFRNNYKDVGGRESNALAEAAWNAAPRGVSQREALVAYADDPVPAQPVAPVAQVPEVVREFDGLRERGVYRIRTRRKDSMAYSCAGQLFEKRGKLLLALASPHTIRADGFKLHYEAMEVVLPNWPDAMLAASPAADTEDKP